MGDFFLALGVLLAIGLLILPVVSVALAVGARRRIVRLEAENESRAKELRYLYDKLRELEAAPRASPAAAPPPPPRAGEDAAAVAAAARAFGVAPAGGIAPEVPPPENAATQPSVPASAAAASPAAGAPAETAPPPPPPPPPPPRVPAPEVPLEQRLATWFTRVGAGAVLLAVLYFFKYAYDNAWVGPTGRVLIGAGAGVAILVAAEVIRSSTKPSFVHALLGVGLAALYVSVWAAQLPSYGLIGTEVAFGANAVVLLAGAALAFRHRAEPVLVLVSIAGFLNPVLLSTGQDRPFALFSYLFVMTSVVLLVAVRHRFAVATALAIAGVAVLFTGWYAKFFEVFDHRGQPWAGDRPPEELVGAYHEISARAVPLAFVLLFTAQWLTAAFSLKRLGASLRWSLPIVLAALLLSHAGAAGLLFDRAIPLGVSTIALALVAVPALSALGKSDLLLVPMIAAFGVLAVRSGDTPTPEQTWMLALLGVWSGVYVVAFLRNVERANQEVTPAAATRAAIGLGIFALLATILLLDSDRPRFLAAIVAGLSALVAAIAHRANARRLATAALIASGALVAISATALAEHHLHADAAFLALAAVWSAVYAGAVLIPVARNRRAADWLDLATLSAAGLAFVGLAIQSTSEEVLTLRALLTAAVGLADLAFALIVERTRPDLKGWVTVLAAQALGLFAAAVGFALSGASVTIVWAILATVAALIYSRSNDPAWGVTLAILAVLTLGRLVAVDVEDAERLVSTFRSSGGRSGLYRIPVLFNQRAYALAGTGLAFLFSARFLAHGTRPDTDAPRRTAAALLSIAAYTLIVSVLITEARSAALVLPDPPPMPLDLDEFQAFLDLYWQAHAAQVGKLAMITTVTLAVAAMVLLGLGFAMKDGFHRWLGLAVFVGTIGKLVVWDIWNLPRVYQIVVLSVVGALLLGSGFLYARLKTLFVERASANAAAILLAIFATFAASSARAAPGGQTVGPRPVEVHRFETLRPIEGADAPGDYAAPVDLDLYRASKSAELLADIRIAGPSLSPAAHLIRDVAAARPDIEQPGEIFDAGEIGEGATRALFRIPEGREHCRVRLELRGDEPFVRRTLIETGEKPKDMQVVAEGALVYAIPGTADARSSLVRYPRSMATLVRVTLLPDSEARATAISGAWFGCGTPESVPPVVTFPLSITGSQRDDAAKTTTLELDAGSEGVPIDAIVLDVATQELSRKLEVHASSYRSSWPLATSGWVYRVQRSRAPVEDLEIRLGGVRKRYLRLVFFDEDNAPLDVRGVTAKVAARELVFRTTERGAHTLYAGDPEGVPPSYDLAAILQARDTPAALLPAKLGAPATNPELGKERPRADLPVTERYRGAIGAVLAVLLVGIAVWAVRLIRTDTPAPPAGTEGP